VDLLEYMRSQNNMTQAEWERTFEDEAREILVLPAGPPAGISVLRDGNEVEVEVEGIGSLVTRVRD